MTHQPIHSLCLHRFTASPHSYKRHSPANHALYITRTAFANADSSLSLTYATPRLSSLAIASISCNLSSSSTASLALHLQLLPPSPGLNTLSTLPRVQHHTLTSYNYPHYLLHSLAIFAILTLSSPLLSLHRCRVLHHLPLPAIHFPFTLSLESFFVPHLLPISNLIQPPLSPGVKDGKGI